MLKPLTPQLMMELVHPRYTWGMMHQAIQDVMIRLITGKSKRVIISTPPQHGKSTLMSQIGPAWYLSLLPESKLILLSYSKAIAGTHAEHARDVFAEFAPALTGARLHPGKQNKHEWFTDQGGYLYSASIYGSVTGYPAQGVIIDDCIKGDEQANSPVMREKAWTTFNSVVESRLSPDGWIAIISTRWHADDLPGRCLALEDSGWEVIRLPALAEQDDFLGRKEGEPLFPERYSLKWYLDRRRMYEDSGLNYQWHALYQADPRLGNAASEWRRHEVGEHLWYDELPPGLKVKIRIMSVDPSKGKAKIGDRSAILYVLYDHNGHFWVHDAIIQRMPYNQCEDAVVSLAGQYMTDRDFGLDALIVDTNFDQIIIYDNIIKKARAKGLHLPGYPWEDDIEKELRIKMKLSPILAQQRLHLNKRNPHLRILFNELRDFPSLIHDDAIDSLAYAIIMHDMLLRGRKKPQQLVLSV